MTGPVIAVVCGKTKRNHPTRIADLYLSHYVREAVRWARSIPGARFYILSGGLGFIHSDTVVEPYEVQPRTKSRMANKDRGADTIPQISDDAVRDQLLTEQVTGEILVVGGDAYTDILRRAGAGLVTVRRPFYDLATHRFRDGRIGYQRFLFREYHGRIPPALPPDGGCLPDQSCCGPRLFEVPTSPRPATVGGSTHNN